MLRNSTVSIARRYFCDVKSLKPKVCVVGAGPAGFYAAQHLAKKLKEIQVDILEKLPVPFGLVRFGVAPDHPEVKNVIHTFTKTAESPNVNFYGNITLGQDVSLRQLRELYHVVLLTYGAEQNQKLNIPGDSHEMCFAARKVVGWYNGVPSDANLCLDLNCESVALIGQGNVAIDVARILLTPIDELKKTDITQYALDQLSTSKVKRVYLIGRRGPLQAAFTIKELREMLKLPNCSTIWREEQFQDVTPDVINKLGRPKKRITELMLKSVRESPRENPKGFYPIFMRTPLEIFENKILLGVNKLAGDDLLTQKAVLTDNKETIESELVITSIGYKGVPADPDLPFIEDKGVVKNDAGRVDKGLYTSGWLASGPMGVILTTMSNAFGVAEQIIKDITNEGPQEPKPGFSELKRVLQSKNVQIVEWSDWEKIDKYEVEQGEKLGKPREKVLDVRKMLEIASG
ncbi:LOW QUALITY PROTEIN: NADPH:adrenodoxin oxidoreductase, mitochondrial [Anthonomus grandis grandis]|uniref:LOW QUALITY PROTEIN: NADPH:adrenodoxin oxidoreductase, mitochondrial n=1 Tax=Anthonomus grandis grandis TaxID=2921223 RepID=UPI0021659260|nr:LOW QUALITY PROTEIN: NADPH:adrenodoxin oxidoreductase, mitochondrial [Anthonomus grandis grandis]